MMFFAVMDATELAINFGPVADRPAGQFARGDKA